MDKLPVKIGIETATKMQFGIGVFGSMYCIFENKPIVYFVLSLVCLILAFAFQVYRDNYNKNRDY